MTAKRVVKRPTTIKSADLRKYLDAGKTQTRLLGPLERHLLAKEPDTSRRSDVLHPSEIIKDDWCHRESYFLLRGAEKKGERHGLRTSNVFETGHEIHRKWQRWVYEMGNLVGMFECRACGHKWWSQSPVHCEQCNSISIMYKEVPVESERYRIAGHADGAVRGLGDDFIIEIKSIGPGTIRIYAPHFLAEHDGDVQKAWREIKRPFTDHIKQAQIYAEMMRLQHEAGERDFLPEDLVFVYELKATQETKEFVVARNTRLIEPVLEYALDVVDAVKRSKPPVCNINGEAGCAKCKPYKED